MQPFDYRRRQPTVALDLLRMLGNKPGKLASTRDRIGRLSRLHHIIHRAPNRRFASHALLRRPGTLSIASNFAYPVRQGG
jgi:hypothetical protein